MMRMLSFFTTFILIATLLFLPITYAADTTFTNQKAVLIFNEINAARSAEGLPALKMNALISKEAQQHSLNMAENNIPFGHANFSERKKRLFAIFKQASSIAENAAYSYTNADDVVTQWMNSRGHRQNILGPYYLTGIGIARDANGKVYVTQIFLREGGKRVIHIRNIGYR